MFESTPKSEQSKRRRIDGCGIVEGLESLSKVPFPMEQ